MGSRARLIRLPEWAWLTLGVMGFFGLIALGPLGALAVVLYEVCVPSPQSKAQQ